MSRRIPRQLDPIEIRVLGSLLEKEQTTPEAYPLSLNALVTACGQQTNREPVMRLTEREVSAALERLRQDVLVWRTEGARVERWKQSVDRRWDLEPAAKALLTVLLLRGPQTSGQLRQRSERLHAFASLGEVEALLARLAGVEEPLVRELPRAPGQKERRWGHLLGAPEPAAGFERPAGGGKRSAGGEAPGASEAPGGGGVRTGDEARSGRGRRGNAEVSAASPGPAAPAAPAALAALAERVEFLEARLEELAAAVRGLREESPPGRR